MGFAGGEIVRQIQIVLRQMAFGLVVLLAAMLFGLSQQSASEQVRLINVEVIKLYRQGKYEAALAQAKSAVALSGRGLVRIPVYRDRSFR